MMKPKKNPVTKLVAAGVKVAMRGKKNSKGLKETEYKDLRKLTTGRAKAVVRNSKVKEFMNPITKGKNKNWAKEANKSILPAAKTSRRATLKEVNLNNRFNKHPLVRNAGNASSETKYRVMRGNPIPLKPKNKKPNTVALGAAFGKKPNKSNKAK
jgi:hypothetical protein